MPGLGSGRYLAGLQDVRFVIARGQAAVGRKKTQRQATRVACIEADGLGVERIETIRARRGLGAYEAQRIDQRPIRCEGGVVELQCSDSDSA